MSLTFTFNALIYKVIDKANRAYSWLFFDILEILE